MTIEFIPGGTPNSSSYSIGSNFTLSTSIGGRPVTASLAEYVSESIGPQGPSYTIIGDGYDTTKVQIINI